MPKPLLNRLYVGYPLGAFKNTIFDVKTSSRWTPKISNFSNNRPKMRGIGVFGQRYLLEASKSLPRASWEPPKSRSRARKRHPRPAKNRLRSSQKASKRLPFWGPSHLQLHFVSLQIALQDLLIQPSQAPARAMVSCSFYPDVSNVSNIM